MMTLEQFRIQQGLTYPQLAELLKLPGKSPSSLARRYCLHIKTPRRDRLRAICEATGGVVTANDFLQVDQS